MSNYNNETIEISSEIKKKIIGKTYRILDKHLTKSETITEIVKMMEEMLKDVD